MRVVFPDPAGARRKRALELVGIVIIIWHKRALGVLIFKIARIKELN
ncbi:MAG: hypothetical protein ACJAT2_001062 [Bacteriovoracaceae bacterium]|jgi:hypothetical protein